MIRHYWLLLNSLGLCDDYILLFWCFHVLVKYRVVFVWQMDKCAIFGWMEALGRFSSKIWHRLLFCCWVSIWLQSSVWLTEARIGERDVLKTWELDLGYEVAVILLFENCKFENGKWKRWKMRGKQTQTSASIWQWFFLIRFFHFEPPFPFIKCVTWTFDFFFKE